MRVGADADVVDYATVDMSSFAPCSIPYVSTADFAPSSVLTTWEVWFLNNYGYRILPSRQHVSRSTVSRQHAGRILTAPCAGRHQHPLAVSLLAPRLPRCDLCLVIKFPVTRSSRNILPLCQVHLVPISSVCRHSGPRNLCLPAISSRSSLGAISVSHLMSPSLNGFIFSLYLGLPTYRLI